ncbi:DUF2294 domain-containing protein [Planococcus sp. SE5232]|uniref:DUF2294 domain-containing protein n=1 Tax=unclassified Planococcus (in: firmicutes) TaxID=2662419 RepID=UPI001CBAA5F7|nr:Na-translocating system protein MpsC family protein [Planococcus sp. 4-30]
MLEERTIQADISGYMSTLLRKHFGKGPTSVYVTLKRPYIAIHFRGFLSPMEKILLDQNEWKRVLETRDLLLNALKPQILAELLKITELEFTELYTDWNISSQTGIFIGIMDEKVTAQNLKWSKETDRKMIHKKIEKVNEAVERKPGLIESIWLSNRILLVKRVDILVGIEKALIAEGYEEVLKVVKRPLERKLFGQAGLEEILQQQILDIFMDWDFDQDLGYIVFILAPNSRT